tara:strand:+ start:254 stop:1345 length:1092 start_codon:yes stop_codon:yes gene_type:complete
MEKINLIFFIPQFILGGEGKSITSLCKNINKKNFKISIICINKCYYKKDLGKFCKIYELPTSRALFAQNEISNIIKKTIKGSKKNIFISSLFYSNALSAIFQKKYENLKFLFMERTAFKELYGYFGFTDFIKKNIIKVILKLFYKKADIVVANSKKVAGEIKKFSNVNATHIYPGSFNKIQIKKEKKNKLIKIISIGRLTEEKGFDVLIKAIKNIDKNQYSLSIIGDGYLKQNINNLVKKNGLTKNVKLLGAKKKIMKHIMKSDLLINPSYFEGFPNVVIEALTCGTPVICSKSHGGIYEIVRNQKYGDLFENGDPKSLENKIKKFIKNPNRLIKKSKNGQLDLERFSQKISAKKYENIFFKL